MKNKKVLLIGLILVGMIFSTMFLSSVIYAASNIDLPRNVGLSDTLVKDILENLLGWLLGVLGTIALISFVVSGIMYLVSTGNDEMITKAKSYMMYSLIGVVVALASFVVIQAIDTILWGRSNI